MSQNIDEATESWDTPLTIFSDSDDLNGTNFKTHFDKFGHRFKLLYNLLISATATGTPKRRQVATIAALKAINPGTAGYVDGDVIEVVGSEYHGAYRYKASGAEAEDLPWRVVPTAGTGRWWLTTYDHRTRSAGATGNVTATPPATVWTDITGATVTLEDAKVGDIVEWEFHAQLRNDNNDYVDVKSVVTDGGAGVTEPAHAAIKFNAASYAAGDLVPTTIIGRHVLAAAGNVTVKLQYKNTTGGGGTTTNFKDFVLRARLLKDG